MLAEYDSPFEVLDRDGCIAAEPGLAHVADKFMGGLRLVSDRTGDCRMFTQALAARAAALGVSFHYNVTIGGLTVEGDRIAGVDTTDGRVSGDRYVCATSAGPRAGPACGR